MKIAVLSACSAGIASTYMAAEALEKAAKALGHEVKAETQGTIGIENKITGKEAKTFDIVIIAADIKIRDLERFKDKPTFRVGVADAIRNADKILSKIERQLED
jgi:fructose-specific PTS system IIB-like component